MTLHRQATTNKASGRVGKPTGCSRAEPEVSALRASPPRAAFTSGPWEYVPGTKHHGPYIVSSFGSTIADCYTMTHPREPSELNGGPSKPVPFLHEMAEPNARLMATAPELLKYLALALDVLDRANVAWGGEPAARAVISKATGDA